MFHLEVIFVFCIFSQLICASPITDCGQEEYSLYLIQYNSKCNDICPNNEM